MVRHPVVNIGELRRVINDLLEHVESINGPELRLDRDYYWSLSSEAMFDLTKQVSRVEEVGSLGDSWEFLLNMRESDIKQDGPSLMLTHAAPLLRYIGEKVGS